MSNNTITRVAILWQHVTGYVHAALQGLLAVDGVELFVVQQSTQTNTPFQATFDHRCRFIQLDSPQADSTGWFDAMLDFQPQVALISAKRDARYLRAARQLKQQGCWVLWSQDRLLRVPVQDTYQQFLGRILHGWQHYDAALVPGHKGAQYARHVGFAENRIFQGLYTCDTNLFRPIGIGRHAVSDEREPNQWPAVFLFIGQLIERKGIDVLLEAYQKYRAQCGGTPWELWVVGQGPYAAHLENQAGIRLCGFRTPQECAQLMAEAGVFILPSLWDHWGVVVHEATCAGLPVIASHGCGATADLVRDGFNGYTYPAPDADYLAHLLGISGNRQWARALGANSLQLSYQFDPARFAYLVLEYIPSVLQNT